MKHKLGHVTLLVKDQDKALEFYTKKLDFRIMSDNKMDNGFRWLTICAKDQPDFGIVLIPAFSDELMQRVGSQVANHVLLTLLTDDCRRDYELYKSRGVKFYGEPRENPWGIDVVFEDLYGNRFDLVQQKGFAG